MFPSRSARAAAWLPVLGWAAAIFLFSAQPDLRFTEDPTLDFVVRKLGHMAVFGVLALLAWRALVRGAPVDRPRRLAVLLAVAYAASDEVHQGFVAGRHGALADVIIDTLGILGAVALASLVMHVRERRRAGRGLPAPLG